MQFTRVCSLLLVFGLAIDAPYALAQLVVTDVTAVDTINARTISHVDIVIIDDRISSVEPAGTNPVPDGATTVDGSGRFLMPGIWDMHAHLSRREHTAPLYVANGVTAIREMASDFRDPETGRMVGIERMREYQQRVASKDEFGPRIVAIGSGAVVTARTDNSTGYYRPRTVDAGREIVRLVSRRGGDFIKTYNGLTRDLFFGMIDEANQQGIYLAGHLPDEVSMIEASDAGMRSIEHARSIVFNCAPMRRRDRTYAVRAFNPDLAAEVFTHLVENGTYYVPTHLTRKMDAYAFDPEYRNDPRLKYINASAKGSWMRDADDFARNRKDRQSFIDFYRHGLKLTGLAHKAGVKILVGTDANDTYIFPGFSVHEEMAILVSAGLSPMEVLQAATIKAAAYANQSEDFGSVDAGKVADLLLLKADPTEDIRNTSSIEAVIYRGDLLTRDYLDDLLTRAERTAQESWRPFDHSQVQVDLWDAVIVGNVAGALAAVDQGADVNGMDTRPELTGKSGRRALNYAAGRNDIDMIEALLNAGADIELSNATGFTPLHHAVEYGCLEATVLLIDKGASIDSKTRRGDTPLMIGVRMRRQQIAEIIRAAETRRQPSQ